MNAGLRFGTNFYIKSRLAQPTPQKIAEKVAEQINREMESYDVTATVKQDEGVPVVVTSIEAPPGQAHIGEVIAMMNAVLQLGIIDTISGPESHSKGFDVIFSEENVED